MSQGCTQWVITYHDQDPESVVDEDYDGHKQEKSSHQLIFL